MSLLKRINWLNTGFILVLTPLASIVGLIYLVHTGDMQLATWMLCLGMLFAAGFGITIGYHRLFSHRTFKAAWPVRFVLALFGAAAFQGSILEWCTDHRNHHLYTDTDKDPYSINKGFWYAHLGWLLVLDPSKRDFSNVDELAADPIVKYQHKFYVPLAILTGLVAPMGIAALWGDALGGLIIAGCLRTVINHHMTFAINSICHMFGNRRYSEKQSARDNWFTALLTFGEGYHNFHHQFPLDYRNGLRYYQYDPSKWIIRGLSYVGLTYDLKRVDAHRILRYRLMREEAELMRKANNPSHLTQIKDYVKPIYDRIIDQVDYINELTTTYKKLKKEKIDNYAALLKAHKLKIKLAKVELKKNLLMWKSFLRADQAALASLQAL